MQVFYEVSPSNLVKKYLNSFTKVLLKVYKKVKCCEIFKEVQQ